MVDFDKLMGQESSRPLIDPLEIFTALDRSKGREFPRPAQEAALKQWFAGYRGTRDVLIKLPTGHGKTLIGLLILQSYLNETHKPALYLCPNTYLVSQTIKQAKEFGIPVCADADATPGFLPEMFGNGERIYVTTCRKLFNGKTLFGGPTTKRQVVDVESIVMDDAHKCVEEIKESFSIKIERGYDQEPDELYTKLIDIFKEPLIRQAPGSLADILQGRSEFLLVPYWAWLENTSRVLKILQSNREREDISFVWDFLKNHLPDCHCYVSGRAIEITPRLIPLQEVPTFNDAKHRIFLSATLTEDSFLIRDLGVSQESVFHPIISGDVKYCGERLVVLPTLVRPSIQRKELVNWFMNMSKKYAGIGFVVLVPSMFQSRLWKDAGADVVLVSEIERALEKLQRELSARKRKVPMVLIGQYDGIDLPDDVCRVLLIDGLPGWSTLSDRYSSLVRRGVVSTRSKQIQRIEQGMGRGIRGPNDWCVVVIAGNDLTEFLSSNANRGYLSPEAQAQISIGQELAAEMASEGKNVSTINKLIDQCIRREESWKKFYRLRMGGVTLPIPNPENIERAKKERDAELDFIGGRPDKGETALRSLADSSTDAKDEGWYLQSLAEHLYIANRNRALELQITAQRQNPYLLKPESGVSYQKISSGLARTQNMISVLHRYSSINEALVALQSVLDDASFGIESDSFEEAIKRLGESIGFKVQRPDAETGKGPDVLWAIGGSRYWIIECKDQVELDRTEISKTETGQMANSIAWFKKLYSEAEGTFVFVHPASKLSSSAFLQDQAFSLDPEGLDRLKSAIRSGFSSLQSKNFGSLADTDMDSMLNSYLLDESCLQSKYLKSIRR